LVSRSAGFQRILLRGKAEQGEPDRVARADAVDVSFAAFDLP
jgi:hypothetical protein